MRPNKILQSKNSNKLLSLIRFFNRSLYGKPRTEAVTILATNGIRKALEHAVRAGWIEGEINE